MPFLVLPCHLAPSVSPRPAAPIALRPAVVTGSEYQEVTRPYRRTVFMHDEWVEHRSTDRFFKSIKTLFESGVLRARYKEVGIVAGIASILVLWNSIAGGYTDFDNVKHAALIGHLPVVSLPISLFTLTSPTLGLLLVFKTNSAYGRWDNARKVWGDIINKCRSVVRQCNTFFVEDRYPGYGNFRDYRRRVAAETSAFTRCLRTFLRGKEDDGNLRVELKALGFTLEEVAGYMSAANRQVYALQKIAETMRDYGMDGRDRARMDDSLSQLCDDVGACERIFKTPIPLVYTRHTSRFVGTWLAMLPLAIWSVDTSWNHLVSVPSSAFVVFFLLGIEELGLQIEEPFGILPMEAFCDGAIGAALNEQIVTEDKKRAEQRKRLEAMGGVEGTRHDSPYDSANDSPFDSVRDTGGAARPLMSMYQEAAAAAPPPMPQQGEAPTSATMPPPRTAYDEYMSARGPNGKGVVEPTGFE